MICATNYKAEVCDMKTEFHCNSTLRSQAVTHHSANHAQGCLTEVI